MRSSFTVRTMRSRRSGGLPIPRSVPPPTKATALPAFSLSAMRAAASAMVSGTKTTFGVTPAIEMSSNTICLTGELGGMWTVDSRPVSAQTRRREHFSGIEACVGIEGAANAAHRFEVVLSEHLRHVRRLVRSHAVLAGDRAAETETDAQDLAGDVFGQFLLPGNLHVVQNQWM